VIKKIDYFRSLAEKTLSLKRLKHTLGVEVTAIELAGIHGVDTEAASLAALAHDLAKKIPLEEQLEMAEKWNLIWYPEDRENLQVLHGRIAAYMIKNEHGINDKDILNAVANHTLGRPGMSRLEMIIYSADLVEPNRDFSQVDNLRKKLYDDLVVGTFLCVEHTLTHLKNSNKIPHPLTLETYKDLKKLLLNQD